MTSGTLITHLSLCGMYTATRYNIICTNIYRNKRIFFRPFLHEYCICTHAALCTLDLMLSQTALPGLSMYPYPNAHHPSVHFSAVDVSKSPWTLDPDSTVCRLFYAIPTYCSACKIEMLCFPFVAPMFYFILFILHCFVFQVLEIFYFLKVLMRKKKVAMKMFGSF